MIYGINGTWPFTAVQTNRLLLSPPSLDHAIKIMIGEITSAKGNTNDVKVRLGFGASGLPTDTADSSTPQAGVFFYHHGIAAGGGAVIPGSAGLVALGPKGQNLYVDITNPGGVGVAIILTYDFPYFGP